MQATDGHTAPRPDLYSLPAWPRKREAAAAAGLSERTIRRWISVGYIKSSKPAGGIVLVHRDSLIAFIEGAAR